MGATVKGWLESARSLLRKAGPYVLIEILLPGGTLIALVLFFYQRAMGAGAEGGPQATIVLAWALGKVRDAIGRLPLYADFGGPKPGDRDGLEPMAMTPQH